MTAAERREKQNGRKVKAALKVLFKVTRAEGIEIHLGDREPGHYVDRVSVMGKVK